MSVVGALNVVDAFAVVARYTLAFVFLFAAVPKIVDARGFQGAVANYHLLPRGIVSPFARSLPWLEVLCSGALFAGLAVTPVAALAALLLAIFAAAIGINLLRGREITCGCDGSVTPQTIGWHLVSSDVLLSAMAILVAVRNPLVLVTYAEGAWFHASTLSNADGLAFLVVAGTAVMLKEIVSTAIELRPILQSVARG